jgi:hypothetical protein
LNRSIPTRDAWSAFRCRRLCETRLRGKRYHDVQPEAYCVNGVETAFRGNATISGTVGPVNNSTVAVNSASELYRTGQQVFIVGEGVKTVTDRCGNNGCPDLTHLHNYSTSTQCNGLGNLPSALTSRLY